ncbi:ribosome biogenesis GTPase Der [Geotalea uraniireducens]|uniref:GTPase Der n=1 Tax=Geotalea uraniireducens (strain Rf4) TaxID=351605 RepID=DER_GEOUR|nr:ribosome biogenesis GTPase Der [Geotalea uraniireducens]A5G692.1 RecName: Full=GTPase Der; AltName: Full=GTP-binding protein EngA [Geotalea uraniireducens Rf4]ABQ27310.1 small GTP-binding protein [Geotalea uraniireducens Rf4]
MRPLIAIVGRPNVGKSTLFNRIVGRRKAMVDDMPGVTRDRNYANVDRFDVPFILIDTGGFEPETNDRLLQQMREQSQLAMAEADVILFVMDGRDGLTPADVEVVEMLRRVDKPIFYLINKIDGDKQETAIGDFYTLGVDTIFTVSAEHNRGVNDLMDEVIKALPKGSAADTDEEVTKIAVIGRPNVGKSTLVNRLLGIERVVANPTPGTTRDSIDTYFTCNRKRYLLIDTAGIRRKGKTTEKIEKYSVVDSLRSIERADVVLIVIDAEEGVTEQDTKIAGYAYEAGRGCIFVVNKWDTLTKDNASMGKFIEKIRMEFKYLPFAPIVFVSAKTGQRLGKIMTEVDAVMEQFARRITTSDLNRVFSTATEEHHAPLYQGRRVKFYFATQVGTKPPSIVIFTNRPDGVHFSYERYIVNRFREAFGFTGTPMRLLFKGRESRKRA